MALLEAIKNENARKIFGERELKIIEKQLKGVKLKPSEIVRLSRDIRKKLEVIKEFAKYEDEFELKKNNETKKIIENVKKVILSHEFANRIKKIVLFGSITQKENTLLSDIDIAVEFNNISPKEALLFRSRVSSGFSNKLDLQVYNELPEKIKKEIDKYGKVLYKKTENG